MRNKERTVGVDWEWEAVGKGKAGVRCEEGTKRRLCRYPGFQAV